MIKRNKIIILLILILTISTSVFAHGGNITGWKNKESNKISVINGKYYGYHKKDGVKHYHEVTWNKSESKWEIVDSNKYYDKNLNETTFEKLSENNQETERIGVKFVDSVDGDTAEFEMNGETIKVRFLAVDTPESVHPTKEIQAYGVEASNFTKEKLQNAEKIELEFDNNSDKTDKYNRYLAWIWVDGELLQDLLVKEGLAKVAYLYGDYKYTSVLQESEAKAKQERIKIWHEDIEEEFLNSTELKNEIVENKTNVEIDNTIEQKSREDIEKSIIIILAVIMCIIAKIVKSNKKKK